jgi:DNA replication protein DnaC
VLTGWTGIIASHLPAEHWHEVMGDPTIADAFLNRLVHNAVAIGVILKGESMRKQKHH